MRPLKILAAAGLLAASATTTFAQPISRYDDRPIVRVQERCHSDCRRHGGDWIRYNRNCEPRVCREYTDDDYRREWRRDRRDRDGGCVKVGPVWYCGN